MWQQPCAVLLPLLASSLVFWSCVSCLPTEVSQDLESSGDSIMLNDAASSAEDLPVADEDGNNEANQDKDELFESLAELLSRLDEKASSEPSTEQDTRRGTEHKTKQDTQQKAEQEVEHDVERVTEQETERETKRETKQETTQQSEQDMGQSTEQQETQLEAEHETVSGQETETEAVETNTEAENEVETDRLPGSNTEADTEAVTENLATTTADPIVITVQLTGVPVVDETTSQSDQERVDFESRDWTAREGSDGSASSEASPEGNEVPMPTPGRRPVIEPIIVADKAICLGCVTPILQDSSDLRRVANMAAKLLEDKLESPVTFRVTEVYRASKQVVNGIKYFLTLEVASTSCRRPVPAFTLCYVAEHAPHAIYAVEMLHQPHRANTELLTHRQVRATEIARLPGLFAAATAEPPTESPPPASATIAPGDSLLDILMGLDAVITEQRRGPPLLEPQPEPAQPQRGPPLLEQQPEPTLQRHAAGAQTLRVQALLKDAGLVTAASAPLPLQTKEETGDDDDELVTSGCRASRQYHSQEVPLNVAHPRVQKILHDFLETQEMSRSERLVITDVKSATRQTIAETNFRFEFVLGVSECLKNSSAHRYSCTAAGKHPLSDCRVRARQRPDQPLQFNSVSCSTHQQPQCSGGQCDTAEIHPYGPAYLRYPEMAEEVNIFDTAYHQLVQHVQDEVNRRSRKPYFKKLIETLNATKVTYHLQETSEIVEQELYSLTLRLADTTCQRTAEDAAACMQRAQSDPAAVTSICDVRVSSLGWADRMRVLDLFCETETPQQRLSA